MRFSHNALFGVFATLLLTGCGGDGDGTNGGSTPAKPVVIGAGKSGLVNGPVADARFSNPANVAVASDGTVYVADFDNDAVRAISPGGIVSTVIKQENFSRPFGLTTNGGLLYVQTDANDMGQRDATTGTVWRYDPGTGAVAVVARNLGRPRGILALANGRIALSDLVTNKISLLNVANGKTTFLAGASDGTAGFANGKGDAARFSRPYGLDQLPDGSLLVADQANNRIRRVTLDGDVSTYAGTGETGAVNGAVALATFNAPQGVAITPDGTVYVADQANHLIRSITGGTVATFAGNGQAGYAPGAGTAAEFYGLEGISLTPDGKVLWIADGNNGDGTAHNRVRSLGTP
ncbi:hypothetical protein BH11ARM2_BH11ARM2_30750 [soil metagenome]